jgi:hypothetical protein
MHGAGSEPNGVRHGRGHDRAGVDGSQRRTHDIVVAGRTDTERRTQLDREP